ncbi:MAG: hypothetical protein ACOY4Q_01630 [Bacillota bacterium]
MSNHVLQFLGHPDSCSDDADISSMEAVSSSVEAETSSAEAALSSEMEAMFCMEALTCSADADI